MKPAAFLDRDGVINLDHGYVARREDFMFVDGLLDAAQALHALGYALVIASNQSGIGRGLYSEADFLELMQWVRGEFAAAGAPLAGVYFCPHHPSEAIGAFRVHCDCRKPGPKMLRDAARDLTLDLPRSVMFGDKPSDLQAAQAAGVLERVYLGTDGRAVPAPLKGDLASARYRSVADAMADAAFVARLREAAQ